MSEPRSRSGGTRSLLAVSVSLCVLAASASTLADDSEIDSFVRAFGSQTKQDALAYIKAFPSSHFVPDLIELLSPEVAQQVCADLGASAPGSVHQVCERQRQQTPVLNQLDAKFDALVRVNGWLNERAASLRQQADEADAAVEAYLESKITQVSSQLQDARAAQTAAQTKLDQARAFQRDSVQLVLKLIPDHPGSEAQLRSLINRIEEEVQRVIRGIEPQVAAAKARADALEAELARLQSIKCARCSTKLKPIRPTQDLP